MSDPRHDAGSGSAQPSSATSRSLLERVRANDASAWEQLVRLYAPLVLHWCRRWGLQNQDCADVFQEVFQAVAAHIASFRREREGDTFRGWLRTITQSKVCDHFRRRGREPDGVGGTDAQRRMAQVPAPDSSEEDSAAEQTAEGRVVHQVLGLIRGEFEERTWQAFWRTAVEGQSAPEVAAALAMSPGAVRVAKSRVLHRLREELGDLMG
jgi:RNA polymerase sigma-70 factor, ECF subfamily